MIIKVEIKNKKRSLYFNFSDIKKAFIWQDEFIFISIVSDCWKSKIFGRMGIKYTKNIDTLSFL